MPRASRLSLSRQGRRASANLCLFLPSLKWRPLSCWRTHRVVRSMLTGRWTEAQLRFFLDLVREACWSFAAPDCSRGKFLRAGGPRLKQHVRLNRLG